MKKLNKIGYIAIMMVLAFILGIATPAFAASDVIKQLTAYFTSGGKPYTVYINGEKITPKDGNGKVVEPFAVDGTTYLPIRAIANAFGKDVTWDGTTASVKIDDKVASASTTAPATTSDSQDINRIVTTRDADGGLSDSLTNYKFITDKDAIGQWEQIDFIASPARFDPTNLTRKDYIWPVTHNFYDDGSMVSNSVNGNGVKETSEQTWTKGYIDNGAYVIQKIDGKTVMFWQWKSGDYTRYGTINCYVFLKTSDTPDPSIAPKKG